MRYVIIGNSTAGIGAVEGIRQIDRDGEIIMISHEPYHTYSRPLISYFVQGKIDEQKMKYRDDGFYHRNNCKTLFSRKAVLVKPEEKKVVLEDGLEISYDKLLAATGSSAFFPAMKGLERVANQFTFMSLEEAKKLDRAITRASRVLIIGAGLIGLKCAEGIQKKVGSITIVDLAPTILSSILDGEGAKIVQTHLEKTGLKFILSSSAQSFDGNKATLSNGDTVEFDILVIAVGVRPNTELVKEAGGRVNRGIVTNPLMETTLAEVYAAGDCTESYDISADQNRILAILPNAYMQGECAGINMAGGKKSFNRAIPMNAISFSGLHMITAGSYVGAGYTHTENTDSYKRFYTKDGILRGYILIGKVEKAGIYTSLIRERTPLNTLDFELIMEKPGLMAFSKEERQIKLGGAKQ